MLFEVIVNTVDDREQEINYVERFIEAPTYKMIAGTVTIHDDLYKWAEKFAQEWSVMWGFVKVHVTISRYFPMRIGFKADNGSCVSSLLTEWDEQAEQSGRSISLADALATAMKVGG